MMMRTSRQVMLAALLLCAAVATAHAQATPETQAGTIEVVSGTWKVANRGDVDVTAKLLSLVKDGVLDVRVSAAALGAPAPPSGVTGNLTIVYRINGGNAQTRTVRGGGTQLKLTAPAVASGTAPAGGAATEAGAAGAGRIMPMLFLTTQEPRDNANGSSHGGLLVRELQRQAVLIAARDEMGLRTQDGTLEPFNAPAAGTGQVMLAGTQFWRAFGTDTILAKPGDAAPATFPDLDVTKYVEATPTQLLGKVHGTLYAKPWIDYAMITKDAEAHSRKEFVAALKSSGILGTDPARPEKWVAKGTLPADAAAELSEMNPLAQFVAVRLLHEEMRQKGASPELLEALVRGYADLGLMTNANYSASYKAYMARSLLYAERMVVHFPNDARGYYVRAYARGMAGLGRLALLDLAEGKKRLKAADTAPSWSAVISAWCRYDFAEMKRLGEKGGADGKLAQMLAVGIAVDGYESSDVEAEGDKCLQRQPDNFWVAQQIYKTHTWESPGEAPALISAVMPNVLRRDGALLALPAEAETLRSALQDKSDPQWKPVADFASALRQITHDGKDAGEPSLAAFASLVSDEEFLAAYWTNWHEMHHRHVALPAVTAFAAASAPAWKDYPAAGLMAALTIDPGLNRAAYLAAMGRVKSTDAGAWFMDELNAGLSWDEYKDRWAEVLLAEGHADLLPMDFSALSIKSVRIDQEAFLAALREESPNAAKPMAGWMSSVPWNKRHEDQVLAESAIAEVQARFVNRSAMVLEAAEWASDIHDHKQAINMLEELQRKSPSPQGAATLFSQYEQTEQLAKAKALVDQSGKGPGQENYFGGQAGLATVYSRRFMFAEALPYALVAASTQDSRAVTGLASCYASMGQTQNAEAALKSPALSGTYETLRWYAYARRFKLADVSQAKQALDTYMSNYPKDLDVARDRALLEGDAKKALTALRARRDTTNKMGEPLNYAAVAAQAGDAAEAKFALEKGAADEMDHAYKLASVALLAISGGADVESSLRPVELVLGPPRTDYYNVRTQVGQFLAATGHKTEAVKWLTLALLQNGATSAPYQLAWMTLEKLGADPAKLLKTLQDKKVDAAALTGAWKVQDGADAVEWTFSADSLVESSNGLHGQWWENDGRLCIAWTPKIWAVAAWPHGGSLKGDSQAGKDKLTAVKK